MVIRSLVSWHEARDAARASKPRSCGVYKDGVRPLLLLHRYSTNLASIKLKPESAIYAEVNSSCRAKQVQPHTSTAEQGAYLRQIPPTCRLRVQRSQGLGKQNRHIASHRQTSTKKARLLGSVGLLHISSVSCGHHRRRSHWNSRATL